MARRQPKKRGPGRPRVARPTDSTVTARLTPQERQAAERAAKRSDLRLSAWVRRAIRAALGL